jgi:hypothetical protein
MGEMHPLEGRYGLSASDLLDAIDRRFRARVTLEGAVAEVQLGKHIERLRDAGTIERFEWHDRDGHPDYTIWTPGGAPRGYLVECKNVRDSDEAYRESGGVVAYKVETQKTRVSQGDPMSRFYDFGYFAVLAVCLGKKTGDWRMFMFAVASNLAPRAGRPDKLAVFQRVPLPSGPIEHPWYPSLDALIASRKL